METFKKCLDCKQLVNISNYYKQKNRKDGLCARCKTCDKLHVKKWKKNNPDAAKSSYLKQKYSISIESYNLLLKDQNNNCKICKRNRDQFTKSFAVDHCHKTLKVRALLCSDCNTSLGLTQENTQTLQNMIEYLEFHKKNPDNK